MVKAYGEESGKLTQVFAYMADYLDRQYALTSDQTCTRIPRRFVIGIFIAVMILMFTVVVPKLAAIIQESGQEVPIYTKVVMAISVSLCTTVYSFLSLLWLRLHTSVISLVPSAAKEALDEARLGIPIVGNLYKKLYLARIADNGYDALV